MNDTAIFERQHSQQAALRGVPSLVWRAGQERRMGLIRQWAPLDGAARWWTAAAWACTCAACKGRAPQVWGLDVEHEHVVEAAANAPGAGLCQAAGEALPYPDEQFDLVLSHEVIEHVQDDRAYASEMIRVSSRAAGPSSSVPTGFIPSRPTATTGAGSTILATRR